MQVSEPIYAIHSPGVGSFDPSLHSSSMLADHDGLLMESRTGSPTAMFMKKAPLSKAERRAEHNAIERARRETLNGKFQQLAEALPNLQNYRRPSKGQIVEKALDWVRQSISREDKYQYQILQLQRENKRLLLQLNMNQQQQQQQQQQHPLQPSLPMSQSSDGHITPPPPMSSTQAPNVPSMPNGNGMMPSASFSMVPSPYSMGTDSRRGSCFEEDDTIDYAFPIVPMPAPTAIAADGVFTASPEIYMHSGALSLRSAPDWPVKPVYAFDCQ
ncbi:hypothetical protein BC940DRAFT_322334 [Gongronella butleri]|nr:hypothetical protein BC940DRAFT_322334 [Gongronella butleri]